jgi:hypothetical protein
MFPRWCRKAFKQTGCAEGGPVRKLVFAVSMLMLAVAVGCGGSGGSASSAGSNSITTSGNNVQAITVNAGPAFDGSNANTAYTNGAFTDVTICVPGTSNCQTISGVLVDTGSMGLRLLASAVTLPLPANTMNGSPMSECNEFLDGYTYGSLVSADIKIAGEQANSAAIQLVGDPSYSSVPASCANTGLAAEDNLQSLGANGILGVGPFLQDCGPGCSITLASNSDIYYVCPSSGCQDTLVTTAQQVQNPVSLFSQDNNGVILELPTVNSSGQPTASGSMVFGIGTQSNNTLGSATVFPLDGAGTFTTSFGGNAYSGSFIDSGSNGFYFLDTSTTGLATCTGSTGFYCPSSTRSLTATNIGTDGTSGNVNFSVANADSLFNSAVLYTAFNNVAGPNPGVFDWGLPFFFGRNVFTAIEQRQTPAGVGPFFAY